MYASVVFGKLTSKLSRFLPQTKKTKIILVGLLGFIIILLALGAFFWKRSNTAQSAVETPIVEVESPVASAPALPASPTPTPTPTPKPSTAPILAQSPLKLTFGIGSQAGPAMDFRIVKEAPVHMLTSWYNGPSDLVWMAVQKNDLIPRLYKNKYIVHLITWTDLPEKEIQTPYGPACGRQYPVSAQVVDDMKQLAQIYNGVGPMYVSLFTEFQTYTCTDNNWIGNENYWKTLKDNYLKIKDNFHTYAPQSKVAISWGSWQSRYDDKVNQGGRSLFAHFADILKESDFTAFQAMKSDSNVQDMIDMTSILGSYKRPVMLAHYKPSSGSHEVFDADMRKLFTDETISKLTSNGLFAISFMDNELLESSETSYQLVKSGIQKYGK